MQRFSGPILLLSLVAVLQSTCATATAASTQTVPETDEAKFVRLTTHLEAHPLSDTDKSMRSWLIQWATDVEDITVFVCDIMGTVSEEPSPHSAIYTTQMIFGNVAYQIENPDKRGDLLATQLAGARSALAAYNSIVTSHPEARVSHLDELLSKDREGSLGDYLGPVVAERCKDSGGA